jgi:hypothetical protein
MRKPASLKQLQESIHHDPIVLIQIGSEQCAPCHAIENRIDRYLNGRKDITSWYGSIDELPELSGFFEIFTVPALLLYLNGHLTIRKAGFFSLDEFLAGMERYQNMMNPGPHC